MDEKIDRIVELDIDFDQLEMDDMGVDVVSLVTEPAIEVDFISFSTDDEEFEHPLAPYVDQDTEDIILKWAEEHGEVVTEDYTVIKDNEEFADVGDIAKAIQGLDILGKMGIKQNEPGETKFRYTGPPAERGFCKAMLRLNKLYSEADLDILRGRLSAVNPNMGPRGSNSYDVLKYKGSVNCRHFWSQYFVYKPEGSNRVLAMDKGPASGDAGKSNNANSPSPKGSVRNNARLGFSVMDDSKRICAGPLMIPNKMILRRDEVGQPYYVFFSKDTVKKIQERFNKENKINNTDTQHDGNVHTENVLLEQWIIESNIHDKSKFYGFDFLPLGTWFGVYKINNDEDWERVKSGELKSFSVAGNFLEKAKPIQNEDETTLKEIIKILRETK